MASVESNYKRICDLIDRLVDGFDFTIPGEEGSLGQDLNNEAAQSIRLRCLDGLDPDGQPWASNEDKYARYKERKYDAIQPGELGGQMLSLESLQGQPIITPDEITMVYGTGDLPPPAARNGVALSKWERTLTDREKADYFTKGGRRFYELDEYDNEAIIDKSKEAFHEYFRENW